MNFKEVYLHGIYALQRHASISSAQNFAYFSSPIWRNAQFDHITSYTAKAMYYTLNLAPSSLNTPVRDVKSYAAVRRMSLTHFFSTVCFDLHTHLTTTKASSHWVSESRYYDSVLAMCDLPKRSLQKLRTLQAVSSDRCVPQKRHYLAVLEAFECRT